MNHSYIHNISVICLLLLIGCSSSSTSNDIEFDNEILDNEIEDKIITEYSYTDMKGEFDQSQRPERVTITYSFDKPVELNGRFITPLESNTEVRISSDIPNSDFRQFTMRLYPVEGQANLYANVHFLPGAQSNLTFDPNIFTGNVIEDSEIIPIQSVQFSSSSLLVDGLLDGFIVITPGPIEFNNAVFVTEDGNSISATNPRAVPFE